MEKAELKPVEWRCFNGYQLDLTRGCSTGCLYCSLADGYSPQQLDISDILKTLPDKPVYMSPRTDVFAPEALPLTRRVLQTWLPQGAKVAFITKQFIPDDIIELLAKHRTQIGIEYSLARVNQELSDYIEPNAPTAERRLQVLASLHAAGFSPLVRLNPIFPHIDDTDEALQKILDAYQQVGVKHVRTGYAVIRNSDHPLLRNQRDAMLAHPVFAEAWKHMTENTKIERGRGNTLPFEQRRQKYKKIQDMCEERGMHTAVCADLDLEISSADNVGVCCEHKAKDPSRKFVSLTLFGA